MTKSDRQRQKRAQQKVEQREERRRLKKHRAERAAQANAPVPDERLTFSAKHEIVLLTGAGIQECSWEPVFEAIKDTSGKRCGSANQANTALANRVFIRRFWQARLAEDESEYARAQVEHHQRRYRATTDAICKRLAEFEDRGVLRLRESFKNVWDAHVGTPDYSRITKVVTTNWDHTLRTEMQEKWPDAPDDCVLHLHGDRSDSRRLLLSTEVFFEPYRNAAERYALRFRQKQVVDEIASAKRLVITGLALSPLDAELVYAVGAAIDHGSVEEIFIADPKHEDVAGRLMAIISRDEPAVYGCHPDRPKTQKKYLWT